MWVGYWARLLLRGGYCNNPENDMPTGNALYHFCGTRPHAAPSSIALLASEDRNKQEDRNNKARHPHAAPSSTALASDGRQEQTGTLN